MIILILIVKNWKKKRYSREEGGYFENVSKKDGYGKKLVYKFSSKAKLNCEWLNSLMA